MHNSTYYSKDDMINPKADPDDFYDVASVASYFKGSVRTVRRWVDEGKLVAVQPSRKVLIKRWSVVNLVEHSQRPIGGEV